jgi:hypothetical protein
LYPPLTLAFSPLAVCRAELLQLRQAGMSQQTEFKKAAWVEQFLDSFPGRQSSPLMLLGDSFRPTHLFGLLTPF